MEMLLQWGLVLPPFIFILGSYIIARKWHIGSYASLCEHGGQTKQTQRIFGVMTFTLALWHYSGWLYFLEPRLHTPYFSVLFAIATVCIVLISFVPARKSQPKAKFIHSTAALFQGIVLVLISLSIVSLSGIPEISRIGLYAFAVFAPLAAVGHLFAPAIHKHTFVLEALGIALFNGSVAIVALSL